MSAPRVRGGRTRAGTGQRVHTEANREPRRGPFSLYPPPNGPRRPHPAGPRHLDPEIRTARPGVAFEEYEARLRGGRRAGGLGMRGAWFKDSEGNILSVVQDLR